MNWRATRKMGVDRGEGLSSHSKKNHRDPGLGDSDALFALRLVPDLSDLVACRRCRPRLRSRIGRRHPCQ